MTDDLNNVLNALTSLDLGSDPALHSQVTDSSTQDNLHHGVEPFPESGFETMNIFPDRQPDYSLPDVANPHHQHHDHLQSTGYGDSFTHNHDPNNFGNTGYHEYHSLSFASKPMVMRSSSQQCPYTTIGDSGNIYKHTSDSSSDSYYVGHINGRSVYNSSNHYLGYAGTDGKVYNSHDNCVGWLDGCHVYNKSGVEVYKTTKGVVGAAAYLLCIYYGGVN